jgi:hypothetical protein
MAAHVSKQDSDISAGDGTSMKAKDIYARDVI